MKTLARTPVPVVITSPDPYRLKRLIRREVAREAIILRTNIIEVAPGVYGAEVTRLKPFRPTWVRPVAVAGGVTVLAGLLAAAGWWLLAAAVSVVTGVGSAAVLLVLALAGLAYGLSGGRTSGRCEIDVHVRHRHRR